MQPRGDKDLARCCFSAASNFCAVRQCSCQGSRRPERFAPLVGSTFPCSKYHQIKPAMVMDPVQKQTGAAQRTVC